jgi:hypothetical protein
LLRRIGHGASGEIKPGRGVRGKMPELDNRRTAAGSVYQEANFFEPVTFR